MRRYSWYALLHQKPIVWIRWSGKPAVAAVVAAPIQKLWLQYVKMSAPAKESMHFFTLVTSRQVRNLSSAKVKRGPVCL